MRHCHISRPSGIKVTPPAAVAVSQFRPRSRHIPWQSGIKRLRQQVEAGKITLRVAEVYPPERAADAHRRIMRGPLRLPLDSAYSGYRARTHGASGQTCSSVLSCASFVSVVRSEATTGSIIATHSAKPPSGTGKAPIRSINGDRHAITIASPIRRAADICSRA
jgi:hypothetical protein